MPMGVSKPQRLLRPFAVGFTLLMHLGACDSGDHVSTTLASRPLVDHHRWTAVPEARSPFSVDPEQTLCESDDNVRYEELGGEATFAVKTVGCDYATVSQPSLSLVKAGENIAIRVWNFSLTSPHGGTASLAIHFGTHVVWHTELPIPSPGGLHPLNWVAPTDIPKDTPIIFHVSNHGQNEYNFIEMTAGTFLDIN